LATSGFTLTYKAFGLINRSLPKKMDIKYKLSRIELAIMTALWNAEQLTLKQIMELLPYEQKAYNTFSGHLRMLANKKCIGFIRNGSTNFYYAVLQNKEYVAQGIVQENTEMLGRRKITCKSPILLNAENNAPHTVKPGRKKRPRTKR